MIKELVLSIVITWLFVKIIKTIIDLKKEKKFSLRMLFYDGGMPSSHSAAVTALALGIGLQLGWHSVLFTISLIFAFIVIYDAIGIRRASGRQAEILNRIVDDVYSTRQEKGEKLKEMLGHDPLEVSVGMGLGVLVTLIIYYVYFIR